MKKKTSVLTIRTDVEFFWTKCWSNLLKGFGHWRTLDESEHKKKRGREWREKEVCHYIPKQWKETLTFSRKIRLHLHRSCLNEILFVPDEAGFSSFEDCEKRQSFSPPSHLKMTTFHLYIVFRLWFWLSLAFGTVTWHGFWQLPAERNKPSTLSTFKWSWSLMYANEVGVCVCACVGQVGGGSSCWKEISDIPPCSKVTKTLSGTRGYIKNDDTHKVCTSTCTELALWVHQGAIWIPKWKEETAWHMWEKRKEEIRSGSRSYWRC